MKKLILLFAVIAHFGYSQDIKNCDYTIKIYNDAKAQIPNDIITTLDWDFSSIQDKNAMITIEIIPIADCENETEATKMLKVIAFSSSDAAFKLKDTKLLSHVNTRTKCFKYRVIIQSTCEQVSEWKFYSFIN